MAGVVFVTLFFINAPYGRHSRSGWGITINDRLGWVIMESASALIFLYFWAIGPYNRSLTALVFLAMWEIHYMHRAFIFPFTTRSSTRRITVAVVAMGLLFNTMNAYLNSRYLFSLSGGYSDSWLSGLHFLIGGALFAFGFFINRQADLTLRNLRPAGTTAYKIPYGGMYRWISCPNYCGEIMIWLGWAIATWSLPGLAFAVWTAANLVPRARSHQKWYKEHFPEYPLNRKTLFPGLW